MAGYAVYTGDSIAGRIPVDHPDIPGGFIDVTPRAVYFDEDGKQITKAESEAWLEKATQEDRDAAGAAGPPVVALAVASAIDAELRVRGIHPDQIGGK